MGRIIAIDYGRKRVGVAVTDPSQIIATGLDTISAHETLRFLISYISKENVEEIIVGYPKQMNNQPSESMKYIDPFMTKLKSEFRNIKISFVDERFTSKLAFDAMIEGGLKQKARRDKALVDKISATILLQNYLDRRK